MIADQTVTARHSLRVALERFTQMTRVTLVCLMLFAPMLGGAAFAQNPGELPPGRVAMDSFGGAVAVPGMHWSDGFFPHGGYFHFYKGIGDGVGYQDGFMQFGLFAPLYSMTPDDLLFGDIRLLITDGKRIGANLGGGYRRYNSMQDRLYGVHVYGDTDDKESGNRYQQIAFGVESLGEFWDFRANGYIPLTDDRTLGTSQLGMNPFAFGRQVGFLDTRTVENAMSGADFEYGVPIPNLEWIRAYAGMYYYNARQQSDAIGFRGSLRAAVSNDAGLEVAVTEDRIFGTNLTFAVSLTFSGAADFQLFPKRPTPWRMNQPVERNWRVATTTYGEQFVSPAIDPATGRPYDFVWVDNRNTQPGDGTFENPFNLLTPAGPTGADIIVVRTGTTSAANPLVGGTILQNGQQLLGEGFEYRLVDAVRGEFVIPHIATSGPNPTITAAPGQNIVTLASNNFVNGFNFIAPTGGNAVFGSGINNFDLRNIHVTGNGGAFVFQNARGTGLIQDSSFALAPGALPGGVIVNNTNVGPLNLTLDGFSTASGGRIGLGVTANNSRVNLNVNDFNASANGTGLELIATNGGRIDTVINDSTFDNTTGAAASTGHGMSFVADGGTINLVANNTTALNSNADGLNILLSNNGRFTGSITDGSFDNAGNNGVQVNASNSRFTGNTLNLVNTSAANAAVDGLNVTLDNSVFNLSVVDGNFSNAGQDGIDFNLRNNSLLTASIQSTPTTDSGVNGFLFDVAGGSTLLADIDDSNFSRSGLDNIRGILDDNAAAAITFTNTPATDAGRNGMFLSLTNNSNAVVTVNDGSFANSGIGNGGNAVSVDVDIVGVGGSTAIVTLNNTAGNNSGANGLVFNVQEGGTFVGAVVDGNFSDNPINAVQGTVFGPGSSATLTMSGTPSDRSGQDGFLFNVADQGTLAASIDTSSFNNAGGHGIRGDIDTGGQAQLIFTDSTANNAQFNGLLVTGQNNSLFEGTFVNTAFNNAGLNAASSFRNGFEVDVNNSHAVLSLTNTTANGAGNNGLVLTATAAGTINAAALGGSFSNNAGHGVLTTAIGPGSVVNLFMDGTVIDNNGVNGVTATATGGATLGFGLDNGSISNNQFHGVLANISGAGTTGNFSFEDTAIDNNGQSGILGDGFNLTTTGGATSNVNFVIGSVSNNRNNGMRFVVPDLGSTVNLSIDRTVVDNNITGEGLSFDVTGGGQFFANVTGASFSNNGGTGVRGFVSGTDSNAEASFTGAAADGNGNNGFDFTVQDEGRLIVALLGGTSGSFNTNTGLKFLVQDPNTIGELIMSGDNQFINNGIDTDRPGAEIDAINVTSFNASIAGNFSGNGNDGVDVNIINSIAGNLSITGTMSNNVRSGIDVNIENSTLDNLAINDVTVENNSRGGIQILANNSTINNSSLTNSRINSNTEGSGVLFRFTNSDAPNLTIDGNESISNNELDGITFDFQDSPITGLTITNNAAIDGNGQNGIRFDLRDSPFTDLTIDGNSLTGNNGDGILFDLNDSSVSGLIARNTINENGGNGINFVTFATVPMVVDFGTPAQNRAIIDNVIDGNGGAGILATISDNTTFLADVTGNNISNNGSFGLGIIADGDAQFALATGTKALTIERSIFENNTNAGIGIDATGIVVGSITIADTTIANTQAGTLPNFGGEGVLVRLSDRAELTTAVFSDGSIFSGNASDGLAFTLIEDAAIPSLLIDANTISLNQGSGIRFNRRDRTELVATITNNLIDQNDGHGIDLFASNRDTPTIDFTIDDNVITNNAGNGMNFFLEADAVVQVMANRNIISTNEGHGVSVVTNQRTAFGLPADLINAIPGVPATFNNNIINSNGLNGFNVVANNDSFVHVLIDSPFPALNGFAEISNNAGHGINWTANANSTTALEVYSTRIENNGGNGINFNAAGSSSSDLILGANGEGNIISGNAGNGVEINTTAFSAANIQLTSNQINANEGDGITLDHSGRSTNISVAAINNIVRFNQGRGMAVEFSDTVGTGVPLNSTQSMHHSNAPGIDYTVTGNVFGENALEGFFYRTDPGTHNNREVLLPNAGFPGDNRQPPYNPNDPVFLATPGYLSPYLNTFVDVVTNLVFTNNTVRNNGTSTGDVRHGMEIQVGTNSYVSADVQSNVFTGNGLDDFRTSSFLTAGNTQNSIDRSGATTFDSVFLDDTAQLDLRFVNNVGDWILPTAEGARYTNSDPGKGVNNTFRQGFLFQVDNGPGLNASNDFQQQGVQQDILGAFTSGNYHIRLIADPSFPNPNFPPPLVP
jgi:trimeric autotransporter adhesin